MITETNGYYIQKDVFLFRPLDISQFDENKSRTTAKRQIILIPKGRSNFDFVSLLDLCEFINDGYFATAVSSSKTTAYLSIYSRKHHRFDFGILDEENLVDSWCFLITIKLRSFDITVSIQHHLNDFTFDFDSDFTPIITLEKPKANNIQSSLDNNSPMYRLSTFCSKSRKNIPLCIANYFRKLKRTHAPSSKQSHTDPYKSLEKLLKACPGYVHIDYFATTNENGEREIVGINKLSIVFNWATTQLLKAHYLELDASFKAVKPMAYCVAQGIIYNESIPLSISIANSESKDLYDLVFNDLNKAFEEELKDGKAINTSSNKLEIDSNGQITIKWHKFHVLSDMGQALCSCCTALRINQFFCHRHILEHFGSSSPLGIFAGKILRCFSEENCRAVIAEVSVQLDEYEKCYKEKHQKLPKQLESKINDLRTMIKLNEGDPNSHYYYERWALWIRAECHVTSCSNHSESLHSVLNRIVSSDFVTQLENLIRGVLRHHLLLKDRVGKSINRKINDNISYIIKKLADSSFDVFSYVKDSECKCGEDKYNEKIFGCSIPCRHRILNKKLPLLELQSLLEKNQCKFSFNSCLSNILSNSRSIKSLIQQMFPTNELNDEQKEEIAQCIRSINRSFQLRKPTAIQFSDIDYSRNKIEITYTPAKQSDEKPKPECKTPLRPISLNEEVELVYTVREDQPPHKKIAFRILNETNSEIQKMYPKIKNPQEFCLDYFWDVCAQMEGKQMTEGEPMLKLLANFKLTCWQMADTLQHSDKFFPVPR